MDTIVYDFMDITDWNSFVVTNDRNKAVQMIEDGYILCLVPQMFLSETGVYGLHLCESPKIIPREDAEKEISSFEESVRASNKRN